MENDTHLKARFFVCFVFCHFYVVVVKFFPKKLLTNLPRYSANIVLPFLKLFPHVSRSLKCWTDMEETEEFVKVPDFET